MIEAPLHAAPDVDARPLQFHGSALATRVLKALGWRVVFDGLPARQGLMVVYPHTSNWDFMYALLAKASMGFPLSFWAKDSLFGVPLLGRFMRAVGGIPIVRSQSQGMVAGAARSFDEARAQEAFLWIALAPEGTRARRPGWRSGFYHVALKADVPLGVAFIDYGRHELGVAGFLTLTGDQDADMHRIAKLLEGRQGRRPNEASPVQLAPDSTNKKGMAS